MYHLSSLKIALFLCIFFPSILLNAQAVSLPNTSPSLEQAIPKGWKLLEKASGDLNNDGRDDIVFVIEKTDKKNIHKNEGLGKKYINKNPRILAVYLTNKTNKIEKIMQNNHFIRLDDCEVCDEPLAALEIGKQGVFKVSFQHWQSAGSWFSSYESYVFRLEENDIYWIGYDIGTHHRTRNDDKQCSINFLTNRIKIQLVIAKDDGKTKKHEIWKDFTLGKRLILQKLPNETVDIREYCSESLLGW